MSITKYNHEYELKEGRRILDPIGRLSFFEPIVITGISNVYTLDLSKSSNFIINLTNYEGTTNWINFINQENVHRFDLDLRVRNFTNNSGLIKFGDGTDEYDQPQYEITGNTNQLLHWHINNPYPILENLISHPQIPMIGIPFFTKKYFLNKMNVNIKVRDTQGNIIPSPENDLFNIEGNIKLLIDCDPDSVEETIMLNYTGGYINDIWKGFDPTPGDYCLDFRGINITYDRDPETFTAYLRVYNDDQRIIAPMTFRYGSVYSGEDLVSGFVGYLPSEYLLPGTDEFVSDEVFVEIEIRVGQIF